MMERGKLDREANEKKRDLLCWHSWCNSYILLLHSCLFSSETIDFQIPFLLIGVLLSLCVIGIGKIITVITT
jgi:hypothetical protein